jgi:hypothetical protein
MGTLSVVQKIEAIINDEVARKLAGYLTHISRTYDISLNVLVQDLERSTASTSNKCLGKTGKGTQCTRAGKYNGYCKLHEVTPTVSRPVISTVGHNHGIPPLYRADCPACNANKVTEKLLIDF